MYDFYGVYRDYITIECNSFFESKKMDSIGVKMIMIDRLIEEENSKSQKSVFYYRWEIQID